METFSVLADGAWRELEADTLQEIIRRLKRMGIERRNFDTGEVIEQSASAATAARLTAALESGKRQFAPQDEDKGSIAWALHEWLNDVGADEFPESAMELRYALAAESSS